MISRTHAQFWECFNALPVAIQRIAKKQYRLWERDSFHPSLHFKLLKNDVWSVRIKEEYPDLKDGKVKLDGDKVV